MRYLLIALSGVLAAAPACGPRPGTDAVPATDAAPPGTDAAPPVDCLAAVAPPVAPVQVATGLDAPEGLAMDGMGSLVTSRATGTGGLDRISPAGAVTPFVTSGLSFALGLAPAGAGGVYVAVGGTGQVALVGPDGAIASIAGGIAQPNGVAVGPGPALFVSEFMSTSVMRIEGGAAVAYASGVTAPNGIAWSEDGMTLYVASTATGAAAGVYTFTVAGAAPVGPTLYASGVGAADGLALDRCGNLYVADVQGGRVYRVGPGGAPVEMLASFGGLSGTSSVAFGEGPGFEPTDLYVAAFNEGSVYRLAVGVPGVPLVP